jgi:hypothetical protein
MRRSITASTLALLAGAAGPASAVNLLVNGSFESPLSTVNQWPTIPGWTRICGSAVEIQSTAGTGWSAFDGGQWWESDGLDNTCLIQTVPTAFNGVYRLTFAHSARPGVADNAVQVWWNGTLVANVNANGVGNANTAWQVGIFNLIGNGPSGTVELIATGVQNQLGGLIDGVSLEPLYCYDRPFCFGDANGDGMVNFMDITAVLAAFNTACP